MQLGQILVKKKLISSSQLEKMVELQRNSKRSQKLGELFMSQGLITNRQLNDSLLEQQWRSQGLWVID
jgi:hypothetical protein